MDRTFGDEADGKPLITQIKMRRLFSLISKSAVFQRIILKAAD